MTEQVSTGRSKTYNIIAPLMSAATCVATAQQEMEKLNKMSTQAPAYQGLGKLGNDIQALIRDIGRMPW